MASSISKPAQWQFSSRVAAPLLVLGLAAAGLVAGVLIWSTLEADRMALDRQLGLARHALSERIEKVPYDQESVTIWDDALVKVRERDMEWMDVNLGVWMYDYFGHDQTYVLSGDGEPIYAMQNGARAPAEAFNSVSAEIGPLAGKLRSAAANDNPEDRHPRATDLMLIEGRPAIASVEPIVSDSGEIHQIPGTEPLHVSIRFLDAGFLQELENGYLLDGARFSWLADAEGGEAALPLRDGSGGPIGYFIWSAEEPGGRLLRQIGPPALVALLLFSAAVAFLVVRLRRASLQLQTSEAQAQHLAFHDALTGLPNRARFTDCLAHAVSAARSVGGRCAVIWVDLDRFKQVNDVLGHPAGDALIVEFGRRLTEAVRDDDIVARIGGDEFAILQNAVLGCADLEALCTRILEAVREPFVLPHGQARVGVSMGAVLSPDHGDSPSELIRKADIALYRAKAEGRDCFRIFTDQMDSSFMQRRKIEADLREALAGAGGLYLVYQPQFAVDGGDVQGFEALVRWEHPEHGELSPAMFVPIAEESGVIHELGEWVLREACTAAATWPQGTLAVNVSPAQFRSDAFADRILAIVHDSGLSEERLELEITESVLLDSAGTAASTIEHLKAAGIRIALDDFGTGYSSLACLRDFRIDRIKIDQSFVQHLSQSSESETIIRAMVSLARALGVQVTAEGVENEHQHALLKTLGLDEIQGFLFSKPISRGAAEKLLAGQDRRKEPNSSSEQRIAS